MDAENASLGDGRRGRQEEYGRAQHNSESRGFAGFGSNEFDSANGSNGATNRSDSIPDHGYTWTPAPPSTPPQNQHSTGGSATLDPFAAWNTPGVIGDASAVGIMTSGGQEPDPRFSTSPSDPSPYPAPPDDPNGPDTAALSTRHSAGPDTIPGQAGGHSASLASSARIPVPGPPYAPEQPLPSTESTIPSSGGRPSGPDPLAAATTQLPTSGAAEIAAFSYPADPETPQGPADSYVSSPDTGSLPSWLSSIGEEPAPHPLESGGRRRKLDLNESAESAEAFNPFEDHQYAPGQEESSAVGVSDPYELPAIPSEQRESGTTEGDLAAPPELPSRGLPSRASRNRNAPVPGADEESAAAPITARRLPRSAARHAPAPSEEAQNGSGNAHEALTGTVSGPDFTEAPESPDGELPAPRRLPRSAARYNIDDDQPGPRGDQPAALRIAAPDTATADEAGAHAVAPPRLAPPADSTPILDRLLDPEPAHGIDTGDESGAAPVAEILTRILESEQEPAPYRHSGSEGPDTPEPAAEIEALELAALTLVPDDPSDSLSDTREDDPDARPPLETRRSRRAREAAEASRSPLLDQAEPEELSGPVPEPAPALPVPGARLPAPVEDTTSRHSRSEEGADIDIHLIMRLLTASDDLEVLAGQAETGEVSAAEVARSAREARAAVLSAVTAWYGGPAQMVKFANALLQAARES
ncbi:hypothetical protein [Nocardia jinanensis]|uniref:Uncharacterized protein n=1 Tax=Nocardia jinanensis TaxID=382504 RepID=A0A917RV01_9NOCA|nr:hypothetical protein [Nocardia jinanensis]GGL37081.1 hypothetical protein GCM10011588_59750 [Nocardia jinanensis]